MPNDPPIRLDDLRVLRAVARAGGFRAAAERYGLSASRASDIVRRCEDRLGTRLFERTTRAVRPTDALAAMLRDAEAPLAQLEAAVSRAVGGGDRPSGRLTIGAPVAAGPLFLAALAARYLSRHPDVTLDIRYDDAPVEAVAAGLDLAVRSEGLLEGDQHAVPVGPPIALTLAAAPPYLERCGAPAHPGEVPDHDGVCFRLPVGGLAPWTFRAEEGGEVVRMPRPRVAVNSQPDVIAFAERGLGLALLYADAARGAIERGRLVELLPGWALPLPRFRLAYRSKRHMPPKVRAFIDMAKAEDRGGRAGAPGPSAAGGG